MDILVPEYEALNLSDGSLPLRSPWPPPNEYNIIQSCNLRNTKGVLQVFLAQHLCLFWHGFSQICEWRPWPGVEKREREGYVKVAKLWCCGRKVVVRWRRPRVKTSDNWQLPQLSVYLVQGCELFLRLFGPSKVHCENAQLCSKRWTPSSSCTQRLWMYSTELFSSIFVWNVCQLVLSTQSSGDSMCQVVFRAPRSREGGEVRAHLGCNSVEGISSSWPVGRSGCPWNRLPVVVAFH